MKLGIKEIGVFIPEHRIDNTAKQSRFDFKDSFLEEKIGVFETALKDPSDDCTGMCVKAFNALNEKIGIDKSEIEIIIVVTQNPDTRMPHAGAILHGKLDLPSKCASFDISLGCSGFVYGLSTIIALMKENGFKKGILFTADPYSKVVDQEDRNTSLLFGDAATATLITEDAELCPGKFTFGTLGSKFNEICLVNDRLYMNGQAVVKFVKRFIPDDIRKVVNMNGLTLGEVDRFILHQGSKFMVDIIKEDLGIEGKKAPFDIRNYGNTVSSSIPIILEKEMKDKNSRNFLISGFGIGLSWASCVIFRKFS